MKSDIQKRLEYVRSQREILQRTEEELQKQLEAEKNPEFDFRTKMSVGSVWLGVWEVTSHTDTSLTIFNRIVSLRELDKTIYHAHQIVKAAQRYEAGFEFNHDHDICAAVRAAEQDGVLQNLE